MDWFITSHLATDGDTNGPVTMGYFTRSDLPFTMPWPTRSRSATATTARCSARRTRTG